MKLLIALSIRVLASTGLSPEALQQVVDHRACHVDSAVREPQVTTPGLRSPVYLT